MIGCEVSRGGRGTRSAASTRPDISESCEMLVGGISTAVGDVSEFSPSHAWTGFECMAQIGTLSRGPADGRESGGRSILRLQRQTRRGNFAASGGAARPSVSRIATAQTWPTISASVP